MFNNIRAIWHHGTANKLLNKKDFEKSIKYSEKALKLKPYSLVAANSYALIGEANYHLRKYGDAIKFFENALEQTLIDEDMWSENKRNKFIYEVTTFMQQCHKEICRRQDQT